MSPSLFPHRKSPLTFGKKCLLQPAEEKALQSPLNLIRKVPFETKDSGRIEYCSEFCATLENPVLIIRVKMFTIASVPTISQVSHGNSNFSQSWCCNFHSRNTTTTSAVASGANTRVGILYRTFSRGLDATDLCIGSERSLEGIMTGLVNIHTSIA